MDILGPWKPLVFLFVLTSAFSAEELYAYPGTVDIRVVAGADSLRGQARDLEQTLLAAVYSLGGRIGVRGRPNKDIGDDRAGETLGKLKQRLGMRLGSSEVRDMQLAAEAVDLHFRESPATVSVDQWVDLVEIQANLLALSGHEEEAVGRFLFLYNLDPKAGVRGRWKSPEARTAALKALAAWRKAPKSALLLRDLPEESQIFVDGAPTTAKKGKIVGLRVGPHLVQVFSKDMQPFGAVVQVPEKGVAAVVVPARALPGGGTLKKIEEGVFSALTKNQEVPGELVRDLPARLGVDGVLFVSINQDKQNTAVVRGVWVHTAHGVRNLSLHLEPGASLRRSIDENIRSLMAPPDLP